MNCKPGDLAIATNGPMSAGRIVRVLRLVADGDPVHCACGTVVVVRVPADPKWHIDGFVYRRQSDGVVRLTPVANDCELRPIRDSKDGENESWFKAAPMEYAKPKKVTA